MKTLSVKKCLLIILSYLLVTQFGSFLASRFIKADNLIGYELLIDGAIFSLIYLQVKDELVGEFNIFKAEWKSNLLHVLKTTGSIYFIVLLIEIFVVIIFSGVIGDTPAGGANSDLQIYYIEHFPVIFAILAVLIGPFIEEVLFRGAVFNLIAKKSESLALLITALSFALIHFMTEIKTLSFNPAMLPSFIAYLSLSYLITNNYYHRRNIFDSIGIHACYNLISVILSLLTL